LWHACEIFASRDRRYGGAQPNPVAPGPASAEPAPARKWPAGHRSAPAVFNSRWPARAP